MISIPLICVPSTFTPYFVRAPALESPTPQLRAVCPPKPRRMASGLSFSITSVTNLGLTGRKWILSAILSSVWMVAMFGLTRMERIPSSLRALRHWLPE